MLFFNLSFQVWLLSSDFNSLSRDSFATMVDKTYNGIIFFLSFSIKPADDIEKSLGKMFMSFLALVSNLFRDKVSFSQVNSCT
jgi:hypothetical protein